LSHSQDEVYEPNVSMVAVKTIFRRARRDGAVRVGTGPFLT